MFNTLLKLGLTAVICAGLATSSASAQTALTNDLSAAPKKNVTAHKTTTVHKNVNVKKNVTVKKNVNVKKNVTVNKNVNVHRNVTVVHRPYRAWSHRPYYGSVFIGAVALGTIVAVSAAHTYPEPPGPNACWYWSDPEELHGYWDYCTPPP